MIVRFEWSTDPPEEDSLFKEEAFPESDTFAPLDALASTKPPEIPERVIEPALEATAMIF